MAPQVVFSVVGQERIMKIENPKSASIYIKLFLAHSGNTLTTFLLPKRIAVTVIFHSGLDMTDNMNPYGYTMSMTLTTFKIFFVEWISCFLVASQVFAWPHVGDIWQDSQFPTNGKSPISVHQKMVKNSGLHTFPSSWNDMEVASRALVDQQNLGYGWCLVFFCPKILKP